MDPAPSMPERPGVRKEQCWSHSSARDDEVRLDSDLGINQSRILQWLSTKYISMICSGTSFWHFCWWKTVPTLPKLSLFIAEAISHIQPLNTLLLPSSFASHSWSKRVQELTSPLLKHTVKGLGHYCRWTLCLHCVAQCWEVLGTPRGHLPGGSKNVPLSHFTE